MKPIHGFPVVFEYSTQEVKFIKAWCGHVRKLDSVPLKLNRKRGPKGKQRSQLVYPAFTADSK